MIKLQSDMSQFHDRVHTLKQGGQKGDFFVEKRAVKMGQASDKSVVMANTPGGDAEEFT
ncbi:hypothetical protein IBT49_02185 [Erwinia sp. S63]|uniref:hypothetical protein n=1 Tax=Erwinia sp. S63 TaxID=2769341 RepID=UPI00190DCA31|nr:hypothetical protein [Erwinia sp. S63]MBK0094771.1 hypothetical protein [Erwinia sp. S63]